MEVKTMDRIKVITDQFMDGVITKEGWIQKLRDTLWRDEALCVEVAIALQEQFGWNRR